MFTTTNRTCIGRTAELLFTGRVIERDTAHQPIYYPPRDEAYYCASKVYPAFKVGMNQEDMVMKECEKSWMQEIFRQEFHRR
jgi:hypothetical protein